METEMTRILVQGVGAEQEKLLNSSKTAKHLKFTTEFPVEKIMIFEKHHFFVFWSDPCTKMVVISLSINRFPKIRILR